MRVSRGGRRRGTCSALRPSRCSTTLNAAGYRYGVGDQAVLHPLDPPAPRRPAVSPRQRAPRRQSRLLVFDDLLARATRLFPASLEAWFLALYLLTLALLYAGLMRIADRLLVSRWSIAAFVAACAVRHRIAKTAANTLEGYFHPRQLAFAIGLVGLGEVLRGRPWLALAAAIAPARSIRRRGSGSSAGSASRSSSNIRPCGRRSAWVRPWRRRGCGPAGGRLPPGPADGRRLAGDARRQGLSLRDGLGRRALAAEHGLRRRDRRDLPGPPPARADAARRARARRRLPGPARRLRGDAAAGGGTRRGRRAAPDLARVLDGRPAGHARGRVVAGRSPSWRRAAGGRAGWDDATTVGVRRAGGARGRPRQLRHAGRASRTRAVRGVGPGRRLDRRVQLPAAGHAARHPRPRRPRPCVALRHVAPRPGRPRRVPGERQGRGHEHVRLPDGSARRGTRASPSAISRRARPATCRRSAAATISRWSCRSAT